MVKKWLRDISFQKKMSLIFTGVCAFSTSVGGILYYQFAQREIVTNYKANAESLAVQLCYTLDARLQAVNRRAFAALTDTSFIQPLNDYMSAPDPKKEVILSGEAMYCLRDISLAEPLVHSTLVYTDKGIWSDFTSYRNWDFDFEKSAFGEIYQDSDAPAIQWLPTMQDEIFKDGDAVIPYVRRFSVSSGTSDYAYLIIQLDQQALLDELADDSNMVGEFLITDSSGNYIVSTAGVNAADLEKLEEMNRGQEASGYGGDLIYHGEEYLMYKGVVSINDWQIYILKSKAELLDSVGRLRMLIIWLSVVMIAICLLIVLFLSRQMTSSLQRLALQMNRMRNGELEARYYYPYKDEIGSLAKSFNYMADQVEQSMKKQEEYIAVLKEERDFVEQAQKQKRKAELQALQAQINPHFLYNTLNTITWLASEQGMNEVRILSNALGKFFRIGLSRGAEVIPVKDELEHVKSYLTIQEIRYAEVMEYTLDVPEELWPCTILKLVLQPLVENSIYHGIKEKNGKGRIVLRAREEQSPDGSPQILFTVEDTGVGMSRDKVESINRALEIGTTEHSDGYGIFNVNERIKLYYGEGYGLHYESCEGEWTRATLTIPKCMQEKDKCTEY